MKISNYHTHSYHCKHAEGKPIDYVKQALLEGCTELGFSDHCPYPEEFEDTWPDVRMSVEEIPQYMAEIEEAREAAGTAGKDSFPVYQGFECEYDKRYESWYRDELKGHYNAHYLVLGSHWLTKGSTHVYCPGINNFADLNKYIDQTINGMRSGLFAFLAHPDLFMRGYKEWDEQSKSCLQAILDAAIDLHMPLEINGLGMSRTPNETKHGMRYQYPYAEFWEMVSQTQAKVICNADAHDPHDVLFNAQKARDFAGRFGIKPIKTLNLHFN
jgi:histidinol-phosphatase (PHP family)